MDYGVDAVSGAACGVRALGNASDKAGVIDEKAHIREALRDDADVAALTVLVGLLAERQSFVHADHFHTERARPLDETCSDVIRKEIALTVYAPLRVGFPRASLP